MTRCDLCWGQIDGTPTRVAGYLCHDICVDRALLLEANQDAPARCRCRDIKPSDRGDGRIVRKAIT